MINDIFATSMHGRYTTSEAGRVIEQGEWSYRGYGNAEIALAALAERADGSRYELRIHSVERQLDDIQFRSDSDGGLARAFDAKIAGHIMTLRAADEDGTEEMGNLALPPETMFDGPSPIWLIHLAMTAAPPTDRSVTTPVVRYDLATGEFDGGFYRFTSDGKHVAVSVLGNDGDETSSLSFMIADDGCVTSILNNGTEVEVQRLPSATYQS